MTTGAMAALPIPTINRAIIINKSDDATAVKRFPIRKITIPRSNVVLRPITSPSLPNMGAPVAVDIAIANAVHVVLL